MVPDINVRNLIARKQFAGTLEFDFEPDGGLLGLPYTRFASAVHAVLRYEIFEDDSVEVKGQIAFSLEGLCSRCLAAAQQRVEYGAEAVFVPWEPKDEEYAYRGAVDLSEFLRDSVLFALPQKLLCRTCAQEE